MAKFIYDTKRKFGMFSMRVIAMPQADGRIEHGVIAVGVPTEYFDESVPREIFVKGVEGNLLTPVAREIEARVRTQNKQAYTENVCMCLEIGDDGALSIKSSWVFRNTRTEKRDNLVNAAKNGLPTAIDVGNLKGPKEIFERLKKFGFKPVTGEDLPAERVALIREQLKTARNLYSLIEMKFD